MARQRKCIESDRLLGRLIAEIVLLGLFSCVTLLVVIRPFFQIHPLLGSVLAVALVAVAALLIWVRLKTESVRAPAGHLPRPTTTASQAQTSWTMADIVGRMRVIDWYQFEKLNAAILTGEGWTVERKGGAAPDGGVDLVAVKDGLKILVQCKHWRGWKVQEKVVREMLGSMTHFGVTVGAIHTLKGWTRPAKKFANEHGIDLADEQELARRARASLTDEALARWLLDDTHHCPKCEAEMVLRTGDFKSFWGCPHYPRCRGTLRETVLVVVE